MAKKRSTLPATERKASGGSTLRQLKTSLKDLGLVGARRPAKKRTIAAGKATATRSEKEERQAKLAKLHAANPNGFELKFNKQKHDVMGRRVRGSAVGKPGVARKKGHESVGGGETERGVFACLGLLLCLCYPDAADLTLLGRFRFAQLYFARISSLCLDVHVFPYYCSVTGRHCSARLILAHENAPPGTAKPQSYWRIRRSPLWRDGRQHVC